MSDAQWRVLWILGIAFGLDFVFNPLSQSIVYNASLGHLGTAGGKGSGSTASLASQATPEVAGLVMYAIGVIVALWFADALPGITTWFAIIILTIVVLKHGGDIANVLNSATTGLASLRGGS